MFAHSGVDIAVTLSYCDLFIERSKECSIHCLCLVWQRAMGMQGKSIELLKTKHYENQSSLS